MELNMQQETFEERDKRAQVTGCQLHAPARGDEGRLPMPTSDKSWAPPEGKNQMPTVPVCQQSGEGMLLWELSTECQHSTCTNTPARLVLSNVLRYQVHVRAPLVRIKPALVLSSRSFPSTASFGEKWEESCKPSC